MNAYQITFVVDTEKEERCKELLTDLENTLKKKHARFKSEIWGEKPLPFSIQGKEKGIYCHISFNVDEALGNFISNLSKWCRKHEEILKCEIQKLGD